MDFDRHFNALRRQVDRMFDDFNTQLYTGLPSVYPLLTFDETLPLPLLAPAPTTKQLQGGGGANVPAVMGAGAGAGQLSTTTGASALSPFSTMAIQPMKVDVVQEKDAYVVLAEVPGVNKEELKVQVKDDVLTISGERKHEVRDEDPSRKYVRLERSYGNFSRSLRLPQGCDAHNVSAKHENGVLKVSVPFRPEAREEKHIAIA